MSEPKASEKVTTANAEQAEAWNGTTGTKWVRYQNRLDRMLSPFCDRLLDVAAIGDGEFVLDVGCGCGATTLEAAKRAGAKGHVQGIDLSAPMTDRARQRNAELGLNAAFDVADASSHDFGAAKFDHLISRFGVMFFDDPVSAFANLRRSLSEDATLAFICWRSLPENQWLMSPMGAALPHMPPIEPAVPGAPGPFAFADKDRVRKILAEAGFSNISFTPFDAPMILGQDLDEALEQALEIGPLSRLLLDQEEAVRHRVTDAMRVELARHLTSAGVTLGGATWIVQADA